MFPLKIGGAPLLIYIWLFPKIMVPPNHPFFHRVFHYKPSILGYPLFWKHPYAFKKQQGPACWLQRSTLKHLQAIPCPRKAGGGDGDHQKWASSRHPKAPNQNGWWDNSSYRGSYRMIVMIGCLKMVWFGDFFFFVEVYCWMCCWIRTLRSYPCSGRI